MKTKVNINILCAGLLLYFAPAYFKSAVEVKERTKIITGKTGKSVQDSIALLKAKFIMLQSEHADSKLAMDWFIAKKTEYTRQLMDTLKNAESSLLKSRVIYILGEVKESKAVNLLQSFFAKDPDMAWDCCQALGKINTDESIKVLTDLLKSKNIELVKEAIKGLGISEKPSAAQYLYPFLSSKDSNVRYHTVRALININPAGLQKKMQQHLKTEKNEEVKNEIKRYLKI